MIETCAIRLRRGRSKAAYITSAVRRLGHDGYNPSGFRNGWRLSECPAEEAHYSMDGRGTIRNGGTVAGPRVVVVDFHS
jgi:hypothetical protein